MIPPTMPRIDPIYLQWLDLCVLVGQQASVEGFQRWAFAVGSEGTVEERLTRGRIAWARWGSEWGKDEGS